MNIHEMIVIADKTFQLLIQYHDYISWLDFSDKGNPYNFTSHSENIDDALWHAAVKSAMKKGSHKHTLLAEVIARDLNIQWVTYDWFIKTVGRILNGATYDELKNRLELSRVV